jgi:hypothetical protein
MINESGSFFESVVLSVVRLCLMNCQGLLEADKNCLRIRNATIIKGALFKVYGSLATSLQFWQIF